MEVKLPTNDELESIISELVEDGNPCTHLDDHSNCPACKMANHLADCDAWARYLSRIVEHDSLLSQLMRIPPARLNIVGTCNFLAVFSLLMGIELAKRQGLPDLEKMLNDGK